MDDRRPCGRCAGTRTLTHDAFVAVDGTAYPAHTQPCYACKGRGSFAKPDVDAIIATIKGRKGLRSKRPDDARAYYVWRMARFHGGADVTLPVCAGMEIGGDPFQPELDAIADLVAKRVFGTGLTAAHRWGLALGHLNQTLPGLPASAYPCGPVADRDKPESERDELL